MLDPERRTWRVVKSTRSVADGERVLGIQVDGDLQRHALEAEIVRVMALLSQ